jgi:hypothetical protein
MIEKLFYGYKTIEDENGIRYYDITCNGEDYEMYEEITEERAKELEIMVRRKLLRIRAVNAKTLKERQRVKEYYKNKNKEK